MERKKLVIASVFFGCVMLLGAAFLQNIEKPAEFLPFASNAALSVGNENSPVEIVLVEDFQCRNCMEFSQKVIPQIRSHYVQKGKARFTLVPVAFLSGSQAIANAVLEVKRQAPDRLFSYLEAVLAQYEACDLKTSELIRLAKRVGGIDLARLQRCIENECHHQELEQNLNWARNLMGARFRTPALYINGEIGSTFSFEAIQYQIDQTMGKQ